MATTRLSWEAWNVFGDYPWRLVFVGHSHLPLLFGLRNKHSFEATEYPVHCNRPFPLAPDDRYIVCPGAVGYNRDGTANLYYAIHDSAFQSLEVRRLPH